jgi:hypothetical protein
MTRKRGCNEIEREESVFRFMVQKKFPANQCGFQYNSESSSGNNKFCGRTAPANGELTCH